MSATGVSKYSGRPLLPGSTAVIFGSIMSVVFQSLETDVEIGLSVILYLLVVVCVAEIWTVLYLSKMVVARNTKNSFPRKLHC
jgi:hypothetical protein